MWHFVLKKIDYDLNFDKNPSQFHLINEVITTKYLTGNTPLVPTKNEVIIIIIIIITTKYVDQIIIEVLFKVISSRHFLTNIYLEDTHKTTTNVNERKSKIN